MYVVLHSTPRISADELIAAKEAGMLVCPVYPYDLPRVDAEERRLRNMPTLPEKQTYVPKINRKSKRW